MPARARRAEGSLANISFTFGTASTSFAARSGASLSNACRSAASQVSPAPAGGLAGGCCAKERRIDSSSSLRIPEASRQRESRRGRDFGKCGVGDKGVVQDFLGDYLCMGSELRVGVGKESLKAPAQVAPAQSKKCRDHLHEDSNQQADTGENDDEG